MKRADRLRAPKELAQVFRAGHRVHSDAVTAAVTRGGDDRAKVAVTTVKGLGNAVARNRARRRLREAVSPLVSQLRPGTRAVLQARAGALSVSFQELSRQVLDVLRRAQVLDA